MRAYLSVYTRVCKCSVLSSLLVLVYISFHNLPLSIIQLISSLIPGWGQFSFTPNSLVAIVPCLDLGHSEIPFLSPLICSLILPRFWPCLHFSRRDCFPGDFLLFWLLQVFHPSSVFFSEPQTRELWHRCIPY